MELLQLRTWHTDTTTISTLAINGAPECFLLEDTERIGGPKIPERTAIPRGRYNVEITWSEKFKRKLPLIWNVLTPDGRKLVRSADGKIEFEGVRYHPGNGPEDTAGCPLTGSARQPDNLRVLESVKAFDPLFAKLEAAEARGERNFVTIAGL